MYANLELIRAVVNSYIASNKIAQFPFTANVEDITGMVNKIALSFTLDSNFTDKLAELDGQQLPYGDAVEEWQEDLILPSAYDSTGAGALSPSDPTYRNPSYSYDLGRKVFKVTKRYFQMQKVVHNEAEYVSIVEEITKRLFDSFAVFKYDAKRELLGKFAKKCIDVMATTTAYVVSTAYTVGTYLKNSTEIGVVMRAIANTNTKSWATLISEGVIVVLDLVTTLAKPTDESTGEAFIKDVKKQVEIAEDTSEGHSLSGNAVGSAQSLRLYVVNGILPELDVETLAGAFHTDKLAIPAEVKRIKDFGATGNTNKVYAILMDGRACRLFEKYRAVRTQENADGDFINFFLHCDSVAHWSNNCFVRIYKHS